MSQAGKPLLQFDNKGEERRVILLLLLLVLLLLVLLLLLLILLLLSTTILSIAGQLQAGPQLSYTRGGLRSPVIISTANNSC